MPASHPLSYKLHAVQRVQQYLAGGAGQRAACAEAGVSITNFNRWSAAMREAGAEGLKPNYAACGRPAKWELTEEEAQELRALVLVHDSQTFAIEAFAIASAVCRPEIREAIMEELVRAQRERRFPRWPVSLRRAVATRPEERAKFRGAKHFDALSFSPRKGLFFTDEEGRKVLLHPHTVWSMDDYSTNQPYIVGTEDGRERLCRQVLAAMDIASDGWLSVEMIGRERDAYRAEDIVRFILRTIDGQGTMPLYLMLERGRWESSAVHGLDLGKSWDQGGLGARYEGRHWGALDDLFGIIHGYSPRHKACLESGFKLLQQALAHSGREIGRYRSEFEKATKDMLAVQSGTRDARACGFLSIDEAREAHWKAMQYVNGRGKMRSATGTVEVPEDLLSMWDASMARPLPESERWRFLPIKRRASVLKGFVQLSVKPYPQPFRFQVNGLVGGLDLPAGYTLLVAFDPAAPLAGAYACNGEDGTLNREGRGIGEFLGMLKFAEDVAQFDLRPGGYGESGKRQANARASTAFASINPHRRGLAVSARHDGKGSAMVGRTGARTEHDGMTGAVGAQDALEEITRGNPAEAAPRRDVGGKEEKEFGQGVSRERGGMSLAELEARAFDTLPVI